MRETRIDLPAVNLAALTWGEPTGRPAILLHGFPDTAYSWRHLGPVLAEQGWHAIAPFTRGYAPSGVAADRSGCVGALMADAVGVAAAFANDQAGPPVLIGHDWGAITANALAAHPDSPFSRVVSLAVPPLAAVRDPAILPAVGRQLRNSWYIGFNRLPLLPERFHEPLVRKLWRDWSPGYDATEDLPAVLTAMAGPEHCRAVIGYYRALVTLRRPPAAYRGWQRSLMDLPRVPLLYLHGDRDGCLDPRLVAPVAAALPADCSVVSVPEAGHFLQLERPDAVNGLITDFLGPADPG